MNWYNRRRLILNFLIILYKVISQLPELPSSAVKVKSPSSIVIVVHHLEIIVTLQLCLLFLLPLCVPVFSSPLPNVTSTEPSIVSFAFLVLHFPLIFSSWTTFASTSEYMLLLS